MMFGYRFQSLAPLNLECGGLRCTCKKALQVAIKCLLGDVLLSWTLKARKIIICFWTRGNSSMSSRQCRMGEHFICCGRQGRKMSCSQVIWAASEGNRYLVLVIRLAEL